MNNLEAEVNQPLTVGNVRNIGDICFIQNVPRDNYFTNEKKDIDDAKAYTTFRSINPDIFDFAVFIKHINWDATPNATLFLSNSRRVHREIRGLGAPDPPNTQPAHYSTKLQSVMTISNDLLNGKVEDWALRRSLLHEFGHHWLSYAKYKDPYTGKTMNDCLLYHPAAPWVHWSHDMAVGNSPMCYDWTDGKRDFKRWEQTNDPNVFVAVDILPYGPFAYCDLDLYLMGYLTPQQVQPFFLLRNKQKQPGADNVYSATPIWLNAFNFINADDMGERYPAAAGSQKDWRVAFIVISEENNTPSLNDFIAKVDLVRKQFERDFHDATRGQGHVNTSLR